MCFVGRRSFPLRPVLGLLLVWFGIATVFGATPPPKLVCDVPGFIFIEGEPIQVALARTGPSPKTDFQFEVQDSETAWRRHGDGTLPKLGEGETQRVAIDLALPERGLYRLRVSAKSGQNFSIDQTVALTFAPRPVDPVSPWGIFFVPPLWFAPSDAAGADQAASIRRLGASWVRLNFWAHAMEPLVISPGPAGTQVTPDLKRWKAYATALRREGLLIMGEIAQMPRALSSEPANEQSMGDGGAAYNRVKPADYGLWEQLMEKVAREFRDEIEVWEIWNEPDNQGVYWRGAPDELVELVRHTASGLRRGNPRARIAGCGFTSTIAGRFFAEAALNAGLAKEVDVFTFHYSDLHPGEVVRWRDLLERYRPGLPLWNTEESSIAPFFDREQGIERSFKFLHVAIGYEESQPLVEKDYAVRPAGLAFAVAAKILGNASYLRTETVAGGSLHLFQENASAIGVYQAEPLARFLAGSGPAAAVTLMAESRSKPLFVTNLRGKTREEQSSEKSGEITLVTAEPMLFLHGWKTLGIEPVSAESLRRFEAESGRFGPQWRRVLARDASGQQVLEVNPTAAAGSSAEVTIDFTISESGEYDLLLAARAVPVNGNLDTSFSWTLDDGASRVLAQLPAPLPGGEAAAVCLLATVPLASGIHHFRLVPSVVGGPPPMALQLDAIALRPSAAKTVPAKKG